MRKNLKAVAIISVLSLLVVLVVSIAVADSAGSVSGGGQLREPDNKYKISFGGWLQGESNPSGEWQVNFHNVGVDALDKTKFYTNDIRVVNYYAGNDPSCQAAFNFTAFGKWNGEPGYRMIFRGGDAGSPGKGDTVRVELYAPGGTPFYDTHNPGEFDDESNCVGTARTGLDKGNLTVELP